MLSILKPADDEDTNNMAALCPVIMPVTELEMAIRRSIPVIRDIERTISFELVSILEKTVRRRDMQVAPIYEILKITTKLGERRAPRACLGLTYLEREVQQTDMKLRAMAHLGEAIRLLGALDSHRSIVSTCSDDLTRALQLCEWTRK
jgi:hypothetical protein